MEPYDMTVAVERQTALRRAHYCLDFMRLHGFISGAESARVMRRLAKWVTPLGGRTYPRFWVVGKRFVVRWSGCGLWYVDDRFGYRSLAGALGRARAEK